MKSFFKIIASVLLLMCTLHTALADQTLRIGIEGEYPPFNKIDQNGNLVGFDVDIANALCDTMKVKCKFVVQAWNGIIPALLSNKSDLIISSLAITDKRKESVLFSNPYYIESAIFVAAKNKPLQPTPEGLKGKVIGVQTATVYEKMLKEKFPDVVVRVYPAISDHNLDLVSGRIDAVLGSRMVLNSWLATADGKNFEIKGAPSRDPKYLGQGVGIAARKSDTDLINRVNLALVAIHKNGQFDAISKKYFNFDITN